MVTVNNKNMSISSEFLSEILKKVDEYNKDGKSPYEIMGYLCNEKLLSCTLTFVNGEARINIFENKEEE